LIPLSCSFNPDLPLLKFFGPTRLAYLKAVLAMTFWALTFVWIKIAFVWYRPVEVVFLRLVLASFLLFLFALLTGHKEVPRREDIFRFMLVAFFEPFLYFIGEANGMQYVSSTLGSLIISTIPLVTVLGAWIILKERVTLWLFVGLVISFGGVALLAFETDELRATVKGVLLLLLAVFGGMCYGISVRRLTLRYRTLTIVSWQSLFGMLYFLPLFLIFDSGHFFALKHSAQGLLTIAAMSVFASVGAFVLYTGVIRTLGVIKSNLFTNLIPVFTAILAFLVLGDHPSLRAVLGIILVILGLLISQARDIRSAFIPYD
jgi:drug/metabolite transporter (DMT)-like permease